MVTMKLSIVIPTLKEEGFIAGTIEQFSALTIEHEVIVSDGGSTDRTVEVATPLADKVITMQGGKPTPSRQRNDGARLATGEFLRLWIRASGSQTSTPFSHTHSPVFLWTRSWPHS